MKKIELSAIKEEGKQLHVIHRDLALDQISLLPPGRYSIVIQQKYRKRSDPQNNYLWGVVYKLMLEGFIDLGYEDFTEEQEVHDFCKMNLASRKIVSKITGEILTLPGSSRKMTTLEFMEYINILISWSSENLGIEIPEPNTQAKFNFDDSK